MTKPSLFDVEDADKAAEKPHYHGHRDRLRARFAENNGAGISDYELLELLLFQTIPRRDVKPLAKTLIQSFGNFAEVLSAPLAELECKGGLSRNVAIGLKTVQTASVRLAREQVMERPVIGNWDMLLDYCRINIGYERKEQFRVIFLDSKNRVMADEMQGTGTVNHAPVYPREIVKRALELGATALILVHNHPSGDPQPSQADIDMTRLVREAVKPVGILLHDHLIIGREKNASFKALGLL